MDDRFPLVLYMPKLSYGKRYVAKRIDSWATYSSSIDLTDRYFGLGIKDGEKISKFFYLYREHNKCDEIYILNGVLA